MLTKLRLDHQLPTRDPRLQKKHPRVRHQRTFAAEARELAHTLVQQAILLKQLQRRNAVACVVAFHDQTKHVAPSCR